MKIDITKVLIPEYGDMRQKITQIYGFDASMMFCKDFNLFTGLIDFDQLFEQHIYNHLKDFSNKLDDFVNIDNILEAYLENDDEYIDTYNTSYKKEYKKCIDDVIQQCSQTIFDKYHHCLNPSFRSGIEPQIYKNDFAEIMFRLYLIRRMMRQGPAKAEKANEILKKYYAMYRKIFEMAPNLEKLNSNDSVLEAGIDLSLKFDINSIHGTHDNRYLLKIQNSNIVNIDLTQLYKSDLVQEAMLKKPFTIRLRSLFDDSIVESVKFNVNPQPNDSIYNKLIYIDLKESRVHECAAGISNGNDVHVAVKRGNKIVCKPIKELGPEVTEADLAEYKFFIKDDKCDNEFPFVPIDVRFKGPDINTEHYLIEKIYYPTEIQFLIEGCYINNDDRSPDRPYCSKNTTSTLPDFYLGKIVIPFYIQMDPSRTPAANTLGESHLIHLIDGGNGKWVPGVSKDKYKSSAWSKPVKTQSITRENVFDNPRMKKVFSDTIDKMFPFKLSEQQKEKFLKYMADDLQKDELFKYEESSSDEYKKM